MKVFGLAPMAPTVESSTPHMANAHTALEDEICDKYIQCRRRIHPGYTPSSDNDVHWGRTAKLVQELGANPRLFVEAQFVLGQAIRGGEVPFPNTLYGDRAANIYEQYVKSFRPEAQELIKNEFRKLSDFTARCGFSIDQAVSNPQCNFHAFFRLLVCSEEALPAISQRWLGQARSELQHDTDLQQLITSTYGDRIGRIVWQTVSGGTGSAHCAVPAPHEPASHWPNLRR